MTAGSVSRYKSGTATIMVIHVEACEPPESGFPRSPDIHGIVEEPTGLYKIDGDEGQGLDDVGIIHRAEWKIESMVRSPRRSSL
jgi:hypothetical protein